MTSIKIHVSFEALIVLSRVDSDQKSKKSN